MIVKRAAALTVGAAVLFACVPAVHADEYNDIPETSAYAYSLYCANNGEFVAHQNGDVRLPMASTTKIMTAIVALEAYERGECETAEMSADFYAEGSSMYLADGEVLSMKELVGGMLMVSGNDAANAAAVTVGGSIEGFASLMNAKAKALGLDDTSFVTPSGLDAEGHYTTADDLARLMAYCMENEAFAEIERSPSITVNFIEPQGKSQIYYNENKLLSMYEYCVGGKTGYTDKAGRTLVSCAEKDGVRLICTTLSDGDDWNDHIALFDYGFSQLSADVPDIGDKRMTIDVAGGESGSVVGVCGEPPLVVVGSSDVTVRFDVPRFVYAPVDEGEKLGEAKFYTGGVYAGKADITAESAVAADAAETEFLENIASWFRRIETRLKKLFVRFA